MLKRTDRAGVLKWDGYRIELDSSMPDDVIRITNGTTVDMQGVKFYHKPPEPTIKVDISYEIEKLEKELEEWARSYEKTEEEKKAIPGPTAADLKVVDLLEKHLDKLIAKTPTTKADQIQAATEVDPIREAIAELEKELEKRVAMAPGGVWEDGHVAMAPVDEKHGRFVVKAGKRYNIEVENGRGDSIFIAKNVTSLDLSLSEYGPGAYRVFIDEVED